MLLDLNDSYQPPQLTTSKHSAGRYLQSIPANEISESYISSKNSRQIESAPNSTKGTRRKFAPSFLLLRKKKNQAANTHDYQNVDEEDFTDIACYEDLVAEQQNINPVFLGQLDDSQLSTIELEPFEKDYKTRVEYVMNNYRQPPPYPGKSRNKQESKEPLQSAIDTPLIRQLLKDKTLNDNASMNNYWQASPASKQAAHLTNKSNDKLVNRTCNVVATTGMLASSDSFNAGELYEKRRQYYIETINSLHQPSMQFDKHMVQKDTISEIYPARDYEETAEVKGISMSASVPNLSIQQTGVKDTRQVSNRKPRG